MTPLATVFRYPGDVLEPEITDVLEGIELAEIVFNLVLSHMPDEVKQGKEDAGVK